MYCFQYNGSVLTDDPDAAIFWLRTGRFVSGLAEDAERKERFAQIMGNDFHIITVDDLPTMRRSFIL
jgi:hypothetical protein